MGMVKGRQQYCTDCGGPCGSKWGARVRCGPCQYSFDAEVRGSHNSRTDPDLAARASRVEVYQIRAALGLPLFED